MSMTLLCRVSTQNEFISAPTSNYIMVELVNQWKPCSDIRHHVSETGSSHVRLANLLQYMRIFGFKPELQLRTV